MSSRVDRSNNPNHLPSIISPRKRTEESSANIQASPGKVNNSNLSQINSSTNEEENLMRSKRAGDRDATLTIASPAIQENRLIKHDSDLNQESPSNGSSHRYTFRYKVARFMESKLIALASLGLILIYFGITLVNVLLDHYSFIIENTEIVKGLKDLKYLEIAVLSLFMLELIGKLISSERYHRTWYAVFDALITAVVFALVVVAIIGDQTDEGPLKYPNCRSALRLFRVVYLTRKMNHFSGIHRHKIAPSTTGLRSNMEKVLELLSNIKDNFKDTQFNADIEMATEIITSNKLYEPVMDVNSMKKMEKSGAVQWFKSFGNNFGNKEKRRGSKINNRENGRRLSLLASGMNSKESVRTSTTIPKNVLDILEKEVDIFTFDPFSFKDTVKGNELVYTISFLFQRHNIFELLHIDQGVFTAFVTKVQDGYFNNPYHNYLHALDVLQTTNYFLTTGKYMECADLSNVEIAAMYIAASIHDFEHPGTNNIFQMNTSSIYALRYNDKAVLENHHVAACFELMKDEKLNILANLSKSDYKTMRERIVAMVLATDMSQHFSDIGKLKGRLATDFNIKDKDKNFTMELLVHAADISNPAKSWNTCKEWTFRICQEFFNQGDKERELKLPITALCDKYTTNTAKSQLGFIDFVVSPLFVLIKEILPHIDISHLEKNKANWKELVEHYDGELAKLNEQKEKDEAAAKEKVLG